MSKSTIDIKKTDFNTFLDAYQKVIRAGDPNAKLTDIMRQAKELYMDFSQSVI
jgi:hypothetical protein